MEFGYFTLSDNHYADNPRTPNQFVADITAEALYADELGMHSAWIGEHHFNSLGVLSCPDLVLAYIAARTKHIRLAPAVTVLPLHHPIRVAEQWATLDLLSNGRVDFAAGRGYDAREYLPFHVSFDDNQSIFDEGLELVRKLWSADGRVDHKGKHYSFEDVRITPKPVQKPLPTYVASFSKPSIELAARLGCGLIVAPFAAAMSFGGLKQVADLYRDPGLPGRSEDRAAKLPVLHRHGGAAAKGEAGGPDRELGPGRFRGTHRRHPEESRGGRVRGGHSLFQRRPQTPWAGEGRDGPLHGRSGPSVRGQASPTRGLKAAK
jgi:alkanesulfonate monooxygenase SsuD/methylene tetrahydromethanopterin reductase-like flavin-dependent oxidoreductase (luciferase family)